MAAIFAAFTLLAPFSVSASGIAPEISAPSAILIEAETGKVLYEKNADEMLPPASVTKVMTMLLIVEAIESGRITLEDMVTTSEHAASMGGSQVFLEAGESMSVHDMLKAIVIASGNDASTAMAEHIAGSAEGFVALMNERAAELGMTGTTFLNVHGLDTEGHVTTARDIALMSRELLSYDLIKQYTSIWMDSLRDGTFTLANTNKLIQSYSGVTGLKTGSTGLAKYCMSASAERDGMELIAVIMAAPSSSDRFTSAAKLLDFGFANYKVENILCPPLDAIAVSGGKQEFVEVAAIPDNISIVMEKGDSRAPTIKVVAQESLSAPVVEGQTVGEVIYMLDDLEVLTAKLVTTSAVEERSTIDDLLYYLKIMLAG